MQKVPGTKFISRVEKSMHTFQEEKNQHVRSSTNKISKQQFHRQNQFHKEKNQFTNFKNKNQHATRSNKNNGLF